MQRCWCHCPVNNGPHFKTHPCLFAIWSLRISLVCLCHMQHIQRLCNVRCLSRVLSYWECICIRFSANGLDIRMARSVMQSIYKICTIIIVINCWRRSKSGAMWRSAGWGYDVSSKCVEPLIQWHGVTFQRLELSTLDNFMQNFIRCTFVTAKPLKPSGHYMYRTVVTICTAQWSLYVPHSGYYTYHQFNIQQFYVLPTQLYLRVLCGSQNKHRLFPYTALTDWFFNRDLTLYSPVVAIYTASLTFNNSTFCPHNVFTCSVWISEQTAIISLYNINWLVFITKI